MTRGRPQYYKLIGKLAVPVDDLLEWGLSFEKNRQVALTQVGPLTVSTVFLGLDHGWLTADAILFETMVFGAEEPQIVMGHDLGDWAESYMDRYATWGEAEEGHARAVEWARQKVAAAKASLKIPSEKNEKC